MYNNSQVLRVLGVKPINITAVRDEARKQNLAKTAMASLKRAMDGPQVQTEGRDEGKCKGGCKGQRHVTGGTGPGDKIAGKKKS